MKQENNQALEYQNFEKENEEQITLLRDLLKGRYRTINMDRKTFLELIDLIKKSRNEIYFCRLRLGNCLKNVETEYNEPELMSVKDVINMIINTEFAMQYQFHMFRYGRCMLDDEEVELLSNCKYGLVNIKKDKYYEDFKKAYEHYLDRVRKNPELGIETYKYAKERAPKFYNNFVKNMRDLMNEETKGREYQEIWQDLILSLNTYYDKKSEFYKNAIIRNGQGIDSQVH